jgi:tetratricopeptide (TPR) repeat protein
MSSGTSTPEAARTEAGRGALDPDELASLEEERDFLLRSLEDLEAEHDAGDIEHDDYEALKDDYTARAADALRAVEARKARLAEAKAPRSKGRIALVVGGVLAVAVLAGFLVANASGTRSGNEGITGGDAIADVRDVLIECAGLDAGGEALEAIRCYDRALDMDPNNVEALTYRAWILVRADLYAEAQPYLDQAQDADPEYPDAKIFQAIAYARQGMVAEAQAALDEFYALDPPAGMRQLADGLQEQLGEQAAGTVDPSDPSTGSTTTTTPAAPSGAPSTTTPGAGG